MELNFAHAVGNTPLIPLFRMGDSESAQVWVKWEGANPTGSMKDRMGMTIVQGAIERGDLQPGDTMFDYTGGSTGSSVARACALFGMKSYFVTSDAFSKGKLDTMRAFGATLEIVPSDGGMITTELFDRMFARVNELKSEPRFVWVDQFNNPDNRNAYHVMAQEIFAALDVKVDAFVAGVGTGGCFSGNAEFLIDHVPNIRCYAVEPLNSQPIAGLKATGGHRLEGMGTGFIPGNLRRDLVDGTIPVSDEDAQKTARDLAKNEGIFGGTSSGANVYSALQVARELGPGYNVVTVVVDSGLKYLHGELYR